MERLNVAEVARRAEISAYTVRRCEKRGLIASVRDRNGWRWFDNEVVKTLRELYCRGDVQPEESRSDDQRYGSSSTA